MKRLRAVGTIALAMSVMGFVGSAGATPFQQGASGGCVALGDGYHSCRAAFAKITGARQFQIEFISCELKGTDPIHAASLLSSRLTLRTNRDGQPIHMGLQISSAMQTFTPTHVHSIVSMPVSFVIVPNERLLVIAETRPSGVPTGLSCTAVGRYI